jgi:hypothetical protein
MNRAERRAAKHKKPQYDRNKRFDPSFTINKTKWMQTYTEEEAAELANKSRMAWFKITNGSGNEDDFDTLATMMNVIGILSEEIDKSLLSITQPASMAMAEMKIRYFKHGKFGADANALKTIPLALDLHDEILRHMNPQKMIDTIEIAIKRLKELV